MAFLALVVIGVYTFATAAQAADPLPSWNDGDIKQAIVGFVTSVTTAGSPDFVSPEQRIATFDNDGTLWAEQSVVQLEFVSYPIKKMAPQHPEWRSKNPYKAVREGDTEYLINDYMNNRNDEFKTYLSSGGGVDVMRVIAMDTYGIVPDNASLDAAEFGGWHVGSMKNDWLRIFSFEVP